MMNVPVHIQRIEISVRYATRNVRGDTAQYHRAKALDALQELRTELSRGWWARLLRWTK